VVWLARRCGEHQRNTLPSDRVELSNITSRRKSEEPDAGSRPSERKEIVVTPLSSLWLPILLSSVFVFLVSSLIHMATPWHKGEYPKLP